jgi:hypothetical protein
MATVAAIGAVGGVPASADGARGAQGTVRAYAAAVAARDGGRICALLDAHAFSTARSCRSSVRLDLRVDRPARVRVEGVLARGARARAVVDLVTIASGGRGAQVSRARMLLRRVHGRWRVVDSGALPGISPYAGARAGDDPQPAAPARALRRLADDELLALSGNGAMLCGLLAPGAPLGGPRGACRSAAYAFEAPGGRALRLARYAEHRLGAGRARLDVTIAAQRAVATRRRPGFVLRTALRRDTLYAVRAGGRWRLVKPSRAFYLAAGQPPPSDVASPAPTATWPADDPALPSLTETPAAPACRVPPALWGGHACGRVDALAGAPGPGGGRVAWSLGFSTRTRAVTAGGAAAPAVAADPPPAGGEDWHVVDHGLVAVAGGTLLVEEDEARRAVRVLALDDAGRARGPARVLDPGVENPDDGDDPVVAAGPPDAATAVVVLGSSKAVRVGPDGGPAGPAVALGDAAAYDAAVAVLPDGALAAIDTSQDGARVRRLGPDGRPAGAVVVQPPQAGATVVSRGPAVAVAPDGRVLVVWRERRGAGHVDLRGWVYDPAAPAAAAPLTIAQVAYRPDPRDDEYSDVHPQEIEVGPLPGGGWGVAYGDPGPSAAVGLWAVRLAAAGAPAAPARPVADRLFGAGYSGSAFALAGDTLAWAAPPRVAGVLQVRSAALP